MAFDFVSLVAAGDDPMAQVVISKTDPNPTHLEDNVGTIAKEDLAPEVVEYIEALEAEVTDLSKSLDDAESKIEDITKADPETDSFETLLSKADPAVQGLIRKQQEKLDAAELVAKSERNERLTSVYISKAEALPNITVDDTENGGLAGLLRRAADALTPEDAAALVKTLAIANTQIAKGSLFSEYGARAETTISKSVSAAAEAIRKGEPSLTIEQATAKAYAENPDLFIEDMKAKD